MLVRDLSVYHGGQLQPPNAIRRDEDFFVETLHSTLKEGNYELLSDAYYKVATCTGASHRHINVWSSTQPPETLDIAVSADAGSCAYRRF